MSAPQSQIPTRTNTVMTKSSAASEEDAIPGEDTSEITKLFAERLQAWKHACGYLEDYVKATEKLQHSHAKEYEKVLKTVSHPLKYGHHFDQSLGGVAGLFDNVRSNTQAISNSHYETEKALKGSVLPTFERLHTEIKNKSKELIKGAGKGSKAVDKTRNATQKHVELLGQHTASFDSSGGKIGAGDDPYILQRGVVHRLNKQIMEENANRQDLIAVQNNFAAFESHAIQAIQSGLGQFNTVISKQTDITKSLYGDMVGNAQRVPVDFEWKGFLKRNTGVMIDPNAPERNINNITFPNQNHRATLPLISGSLERRTKLLRRYDTNYYVVTPAKFLHEFKTDDDFSKDPLPEISLYLPDSTVGAVDGTKFTIKGKDTSKSKIGVSVHTTHEFNFKAHTPADAAKWWEIVRHAAGNVTNERPDASAPSSPVSPHTAEGEKFGTIPPSTRRESVGTDTDAATLVNPTVADEKAMHSAEKAELAHAAGQTPIPNTAATHPTPTTAEPHPMTHAAPPATSAGPGEGVKSS